MQQFEARRGQLQQRVQLIEQLRGGQSVPVQMLDHVSRSLPDMLWLTSMVQNGPELTIQGRSTTLIALSDFVGNLGTNPLLIKPIEIVNSEVENSSNAAQARAGQPAVETIRFTVKAQVAGVAPKAPGGGRGGRRTAPEVAGLQVVAINLSLSKLPWYGQIGAFVVLALAAAGAFWNFYARDAQASIDQRQGQLAKLRQEIDRGLATAKRLPEFRSEVASLEAQLERLRAVLPEEQDVADLLRRVQGMATQSNLAILGFTPQAVAKKQLHAEWPIGLKLEGNYHDLGTFLERVSKFPRIINVGDIKIKRAHQPERRLDDHRRMHGDDVRAARPEGSRPQRRPRRGEAGCGARGAAEDGVTFPMRTLSLTLIGLTLIATLAHAQAAPPRGAPAAPPAGDARRARGGSADDRRQVERRRAAGLYLQRRRPARSVRQPAAARDSIRATPDPRWPASADSAPSEVSLRGIAHERRRLRRHPSGRRLEELHRACRGQAVRRHDSLHLKGFDGDPAAGQRSALARERA